VGRSARAIPGRELDEQARASINKILNEDQQKRFAQLQLQQFSRFDLPGTLLNDEVATKLKLTGEQKQKLEEIRTEAAEARSKLRQSLQDASQEERRKALGKYRAISAQTSEKAQAALTGEQKQAWSDMLGKPLKIESRGRRAGGN
jgi:hypothetical protein